MDGEKADSNNSKTESGSGGVNVTREAKEGEEDLNVEEFIE